MSPGTAFLLAYLPARRVAHNAQFELLVRNVATIDPALKHAIDFSRAGLKIVESKVADAHRRLADIATKATARLEALGARDIKIAAGFPDTITVDAAVLLTRGAELFAAAPLRRLRVRAAKGRVADIVRLPLLATIDSLDLDDQAVTDDDVIALAASPHAARLRQLDLRYNPLTARGIEALAASPHLKRLEVVNLDGNPADPVDRLEYYDETNQHAVPTEAGKALEAKHGPLRWLRRR